MGINLFLSIFILFVGCSSDQTHSMTMKKERDEKLDIAVFGAGCFWCVEAIFGSLKGVEKVEPGYSGGTSKNPTYQEVCTGNTGHAEVCRIFYDQQQISFDELLEVFWTVHDPTTLNRQGEDIGTQYRSVVFYLNDHQKERAILYKEKLNEAGIWSVPVVTEIMPFASFYPAEAYHHDYYANNKNKDYCRLVITPKVEKFRKVFSGKIKHE
jgi:peptide-methionine (S)-S-oxide reductase